MLNPRLEDLIDAARDHQMSPAEVREQEISFALGNGSVEGELYRGTVTIELRLGDDDDLPMHSTYAMAEGPLPDDNMAAMSNKRAIGGIRQYEMIRELLSDAFSSGAIVSITPEIILALHAAGAAAEMKTSNFRDVDVGMAGSQHRPPPPADVPAALAEMCRDLGDLWDKEDAFELAALALWRLNWVHPFRDGNGRTARALSYLILNAKLGFLLPGTPTILEQLRSRRREYFDALASADLSHARGEQCLGDLAQLLRNMLEAQLANRPALSEAYLAQVDMIVRDRVERAPADVRETLYGEADICARSWSYSDYFILHVGSPRDVEAAEAVRGEFGMPFPQLFATAHEPAQRTISVQQRGGIVRAHHYDAREIAALWFEPMAAAIVEASSIDVARRDGSDAVWCFEGALYVIRGADQRFGTWIFDMLDLLLIKHIQGAR